jgi:acylphosphatase
MAAARFLVRGMVQGVGFRWFVATEARRLSLVGWVANLPDGRVEVVAQGTEAALGQLEVALGRGPRGARVDGVDKSASPHEVVRANSFEIR